MRENNATKKDKSRFTYFGEETAKPLINWLNKGGNELPGVVELLELAERHHRALEEPVSPVRRKLAGLLKGKVNAILADYRFTPIVDEMNDRWKVEWHDTGKGKGAVAAAILLLLDLAEQGVWRNLKRCEKADCRRWFFARFGHQRFCSDECRIAVLQSDPARKKQRAEKMRELRQLKKLRKKGGKR